MKRTKVKTVTYDGVECKLTFDLFQACLDALYFCEDKMLFV